MTASNNNLTDPPFKAFIAYSRLDKRFLVQLKQHLSPLEREGKVSVWYDGEIVPGENWDLAIKQQLEASQLILLLISANFIASDYSYKTELEHALIRHRNKSAVVIPIVISACDWTPLELGSIQALPPGIKPVDEWRSRNMAWTEVAKAVRRVLNEMSTSTGTAEVQLGERTSHSPASLDDAVRELKTYLLDDRFRIQLHDLVMDEVDRVNAALSEDSSYPTGVGLSGVGIYEELPRLESLSSTLMALFAAGCRWGNEAHHELWVEALTRLASVPSPDMRQVRPGFQVDLHRYPTLLTMYAGGISSVAARQHDTLAALLTGATASFAGYPNLPLAVSAHSERILPVDAAKTVPAWKNTRVPFNHYLCANHELWQPVRGLIANPQMFDVHWDRFEYLLGLVAWDLSEKHFGPSWAWAPVGCFAWRDRNEFWQPNQMPVLREMVAEIEPIQADWPPLLVGLFDGSTDRLLAVMQAYNSSIARRGMNR